MHIRCFNLILRKVGLDVQFNFENINHLKQKSLFVILF